MKKNEPSVLSESDYSMSFEEYDIEEEDSEESDHEHKLTNKLLADI